MCSEGTNSASFHKSMPLVRGVNMMVILTRLISETLEVHPDQLYVTLLLNYSAVQSLKIQAAKVGSHQQEKKNANH